ncbi:hypothetical protein ABDC91_14345, partial [Lactiplantibacillus plantarum]
SKAGLEKFEDFSRPALFLETYVTASFIRQFLEQVICDKSTPLIPDSPCHNPVMPNRLPSE